MSSPSFFLSTRVLPVLFACSVTTIRRTRKKNNSFARRSPGERFFLSPTLETWSLFAVDSLSLLCPPMAERKNDETSSHAERVRKSEVSVLKLE